MYYKVNVQKAFVDKAKTCVNWFMQEGYLQKRGIAYRTNGFLPERKTLLLIHGLSGSCSAWYPYEKKLEDTYNLITFDLRGHGLSKRWPKYEDYDFKNFEGDAEALIQHLKIEKYFIVAHSFGTVIALLVALKTNAVEKIILLSPNFKTGYGNPLHIRMGRACIASVASIIAFLPQSGKTSRVDYTYLHGYGDWNLRRIVADVGNTGLHVYLYCLHHLFIFTHFDLWRKIKVPTLVMHGKRDTYSPVANGIAIAKEIPNAQLMLLENANHMLVLNNIQEVSQAIEDFIK